MQLVEAAEGRLAPWTIMPDSYRFQPTSKTKIRIWRVKIQRDADGKPCKADRIEEAKVNGFAIDCSTSGEPFCVIFWPNLGRDYKDGENLEVELSGLCGEKNDMTVFYELVSFRRKALNKALVEEAERIRGDMDQFRELWNGVRYKVGNQGPWVRGVRKSMAVMALSNTPDEEAAVSGETLGIEIVPVTYLETDVTCTSGMLTLMVKSEQAAILVGELHVRRFAGETTKVDRAVHTRFLGDNHFAIWVKIPMPRYRYELRFIVSSREEPRHLVTHDLKYEITATASCPVLLRSIEDQLMEKFGWADVREEAYMNGITLLAPMKYRVAVGKCYFLIYVDKDKALEAAADALAGNIAGEEKSERTNLFSHRLLPQKARLVGNAPQTPREVTAMHQILRDDLEKRVQDSQSDIHFDLVLHDGQHIQRLRQRPDLPALYEGLINLAEQDVSTKVRLQLRFPRIHAVDFSPRTVCQWLVSRADDHVHESF